VAVAAADPVLRLFVALVPSDAVRRALAREIRHVGEAAPRARLVRPEHMHLTLQFLGPTRAGRKRVTRVPARTAPSGSIPT